MVLPLKKRKTSSRTPCNNPWGPIIYVKTKELFKVIDIHIYVCRDASVQVYHSVMVNEETKPQDGGSMSTHK